jgi:hypothetical protein
MIVLTYDFTGFLQAAYNAYVRAKQATVERHRQLDASRKRMKEGKS